VRSPHQLVTTAKRSLRMQYEEIKKKKESALDREKFCGNCSGEPFIHWRNVRVLFMCIELATACSILLDDA
jgi:hypothetical protein